MNIIKDHAEAAAARLGKEGHNATIKIIAIAIECALRAERNRSTTDAQGYARATPPAVKEYS